MLMCVGNIYIFLIRQVSSNPSNDFYTFFSASQIYVDSKGFLKEVGLLQYLRLHLYPLSFNEILVWLI